jgi:hypothetical protein
MRICVKIILPIALATAAWSAPVSCAAGSYASYVALGAGGCTIGNELFSNFGGLTFTNSLGVDTITTSQIEITPLVAGNVDELVFSYTGLPTGASGFPTSTDVGVSANQIFSYNFTYSVTPDPNPVADIQMLSTFLNTGTAGVSAVKDLNSSATQSSANDGGTVHSTLTSVSGPITSSSGVTPPYMVQDTISLQGQAGTAEQQDFTNLFTQGPAASTVPEPSTTLLIGCGLICFGITRKFRSTR